MTKITIYHLISTNKQTSAISGNDSKLVTTLELAYEIVNTTRRVGFTWIPLVNTTPSEGPMKPSETTSAVFLGHPGLAAAPFFLLTMWDDALLCTLPGECRRFSIGLTHF